MPLRRQGLNKSRNKQLDAALQLLDQGADPTEDGTIINNAGDIVFKAKNGIFRSGDVVFDIDEGLFNFSDVNGLPIASVQDGGEIKNCFNSHFDYYKIYGTGVVGGGSSSGQFYCLFSRPNVSGFVDSQTNNNYPYFWRADDRSKSQDDTSLILSGNVSFTASSDRLFFEMFVANPNTSERTAVHSQLIISGGTKVETEGYFHYDNSDGKSDGIKFGYGSGAIDFGQIAVSGIF